MGNKTGIPKLWYFLAVVHACSLLNFGMLNNRARDAEREWMTYEYSSFQCSNGNLCKQIFQASVTKSEAKLIYRSAQSWIPKGPRTQLPSVVESYIVNVILPDKNIQSAIIIPNIPVNTKYFSFKDVYIPTSDDRYFAERNLSAEKEVKVEIWKNRVTLIFTTSNKAEDFILHRSPKEIAIPTSNHPGIILILAQRDTTNGFIVEILLLALTIFVAFRLRKRSFSKRKKHANTN